MSLFLAIAFIGNYNIDAAFKYDIRDKEAIRGVLDNSGYKTKVHGDTEQFAYLITYCLALDGGSGNMDLINILSSNFPEHKSLYNSIRKWMNESL